jgi:hypothetical protein
MSSQFSTAGGIGHERPPQRNCVHQRHPAALQNSPRKQSSTRKIVLSVENHTFESKPKKCQFKADNVHYLGYRLTKEGTLPESDKLKAVQDSELPKTDHQVRQFLGLCNFFRSHIKNFAQIGSLLHKLTSKETKWKNAFNTCKQALCSEPIVNYPEKTGPTH